jgi:hypothetical protein
VLRRLFLRLANQQGKSSIQQIFAEDQQEMMSPIPALDRRSMVLRSLGRPPILHRGQLPIPRRMPAGSKLHVYVDVSGSIADLKGDLYGAVLDCREWVYFPVHLFSTRVIDVALAQLRQGICITTDGTDIACVAVHIQHHRVKRALLLTDGYVGRPTGGHWEILRQVKLGVALTPGNSTRGDLEDVTDYWTELYDPRRNK